MSSMQQPDSGMGDAPIGGVQRMSGTPGAAGGMHCPAPIFVPQVFVPSLKQHGWLPSRAPNIDGMQVAVPQRSAAAAEPPPPLPPALGPLPPLIELPPLPPPPAPLPATVMSPSSSSSPHALTSAQSASVT